MLKGVNKSVIEINCTDSGYFERAILFVNPEQSHVSQKRLHAEAAKYIDIIRASIRGEECTPKVKRRPRKSRKKILLLCCAVTLLITTTGILFLVLNSL